MLLAEPRCTLIPTSSVQRRSTSNRHLDFESRVLPDVGNLARDLACPEHRDADFSDICVRPALLPDKHMARRRGLSDTTASWPICDLAEELPSRQHHVLRWRIHRDVDRRVHASD